MEGEQKKFIERILIVLDSLDWEMTHWKPVAVDFAQRIPTEYKDKVKSIQKERIRFRNLPSTYVSRECLDIRSFFNGKAFIESLEILEYLMASLRDLEASGEDFASRLKRVCKEIEKAFTLSRVEIGVRFDAKEGIFYPSGDKELDEMLVKEPLQNLDDAGYTGISETWKQGLRALLKSQSDPTELKNAITTVYEALEAFAKIVCNNEKEFSKNREEFLKTLGFSKNEYYKKMLKEYCDYAHAFRHGKKEGEHKPRPPLDYAEVEAFVYLTGLFIRLGIQKIK